MLRIIEPELMNDTEQAAAYANADFEEPHNYFVELLKDACGKYLPNKGLALDIGCGSADISIRFAKDFTGYQIDAFDGSEAMLWEGEKYLKQVEKTISERITLIQANLKSFKPYRKDYDVLFSNSLLHHLHDPGILWSFIKQFPASTHIFIMDLMRPENENQVDKLVKLYAVEEPEILQRDFRNSLYAAFRPDEIQQQLKTAGLTHLNIEIVTDRHLTIKGTIGT